MKIKYRIRKEKNKFEDTYIIEQAEDMLQCKRKGLTRNVYMNKYTVGLSMNKESYTMSDNIREALITLGYKIED